jgi:hypothetical protein
MNPLLFDVMLKEKRRDLLEEAERQRLVAIYNADNPGRRAELQRALGDFLIRLGEKLKDRATRPLGLGEAIGREHL